jgi:hypothetical protein
MHRHYIIIEPRVTLSCKEITHGLKIGLSKYLSSLPEYFMSRDSLESRVIGYGLDDRGSVLGRGREFSPPHHAQTGSGAHPVSLPAHKDAVM